MMTLQHEMKRCGLSCTEAFDTIAKRVAKRRLSAAFAHGALDINRIERACREWKLRGEDDARLHLNGDAMLSLVAIARAAKAVRDARRDSLRGDYDQDVHADLARALNDAGLGDEQEIQRRPR